MKTYAVFAGLVALLVSCSYVSQEENKSRLPGQENLLFKEPIGIQTYSFRGSFPNGMAETLDTIAGMGIQLIEGGPEGLEPEVFVQLCKERGMNVVAAGADFGELENDPQAVVDRAQQLGVKYVMCAWVPHERANFRKSDADRAIKVFENSGRMLRENGITLCYHFHGYEFQPYENGTLVEYMIENSDPELLSFEMDILWIHFGGGDPVALLRKYPDRWKLMHLKDLKKGTPKDLTGGTNVENDVVLGTGELDIPAILSAAKQTSIEYYFIEDESSRVTQQVPASIAYLKSLREE